MARPLRRVTLQLSVRLGVLITEIERLPVETIAEYVAILREKPDPAEPPAAPPADVMAQLDAIRKKRLGE